LINAVRNGYFQDFILQWQGNILEPFLYNTAKLQSHWLQTQLALSGSNALAVMRLMRYQGFQP
jgi:hypothetical protein